MIRICSHAEKITSRSLIVLVLPIMQVLYKIKVEATLYQVDQLFVGIICQVIFPSLDIQFSGYRNSKSVCELQHIEISGWGIYIFISISMLTYVIYIILNIYHLTAT